MIDGLRPYEATRPTGLGWQPKIPANWEFHRAKRSFREVDERSERGREELMSVSHKTGVTPRSQKNVTMFMADSYEGHKLCRPGDIVVNTMWAWMAAVGVSGRIGIVSPSYGVYRPRSLGAFSSRFLDYLLRTETYRAEYIRGSRGITTSRLRLYSEDFLRIPFVQPPIEEQRLIARFLDAHGALTVRLIRAKQQIIKLLEEQKQAIIHRAVTRGPDLNVHLKPSGIPWLGDVPEHWEVVRLAQSREPRDKRLAGLVEIRLRCWAAVCPDWEFDPLLD
jgi:type I restriction enzyme S subunit